MTRRLLDRANSLIAENATRKETSNAETLHPTSYRGSTSFRAT